MLTLMLPSRLVAGHFRPLRLIVADYHRATEQGAEPRKHVPQQQLAESGLRQVDLHVLIHQLDSIPPRGRRLREAQTLTQHASAQGEPKWVSVPGLASSGLRCKSSSETTSAGISSSARSRRIRRRLARNLQDQSLEEMLALRALP